MGIRYSERGTSHYAPVACVPPLGAYLPDVFTHLIPVITVSKPAENATRQPTDADSPTFEPLDEPSRDVVRVELVTLDETPGQSECLLRIIGESARRDATGDEFGECSMFRGDTIRRPPFDRFAECITTG